MNEEEYKQRIEALEKRVAELEAQVCALMKELEAYRKPPKDSGNSSIPPSQDFFRRTYPKREKSGKNPGGQVGHEGHHHPLSDTPDEVIALYPSVCPFCQGSEIEPLAQYGEVRQEVELPPLKAHVREYRQHRGRCRHCGKLSAGIFPLEITAPVQLGENVEALVGYLKVSHHLSHPKIASFFQEVLGIPLSEGSVQNCLERLSQSFAGHYQALKTALTRESAVNSDETRNRISGKNEYVWVFVSSLICVFLSTASRGFRVIEQVFGQSFEGVWGSDRYHAQLKIKANHQYCLAHLIRDCQWAIDTENAPWAAQLQELLRQAIAFRNQQLNPFNPLEPDSFRQIQGFKQRLSELLAHSPPEEEEQAKKLWKALLGHDRDILRFLESPQVQPTNNRAEQALRNRVIHRKVSGGFRTSQGSRIFDVIASILETARLQQKNILLVLAHKDSLVLTT
jgi:transposase